MNESASSPLWEQGHYYELRSRVLSVLVAGTPKPYVISRGDIVLCGRFCSNDQVRGMIMRFKQEDGEEINLFQTCSRYRRTAGNWREVNPMMIIALASDEKIPVI